MKKLYITITLTLLLTISYQVHASAGAGAGKSEAYSSAARSTSSSSSSSKAQSIRFQDLPKEIRRDIFRFAGPDHHGHYPLQIATQFGKVDNVRMLLRCGADPDQAAEKTPDNWNDMTINTPLYSAANTCDYVHTTKPMRQRFVILTTLLRYGADKNKPCQNGNTPLHAAVNSHNIPAMQALIAASAKLDVKNRWDRTPLDCAKKEAMNHCYNVPLRKTMYEFSTILESAGAPSSVTLEPMPDNAVMSTQHVRALRQMKNESRLNRFGSFEILFER